MLPVAIMTFLHLAPWKEHLVRLQYLLKNCSSFFRDLVLDYRLVAPRLFKPDYQAFLDHVVDYRLVLHIVQAAVAHQLALVELAVL